MFGIVFLIIYVIIQTLISILTEYVIVKNPYYAKIGRKTRTIRITVYFILAVIPVLGAFLPKSSIKYYLMMTGNIWLGFFMYYSGFVILATIITHIICKIRKDEEQIALRHAFHVSFVLAAIVTAFGLFHAQRPRIVNYDISIDKETSSVKNLKIVLIADLHLSVNSDIKATKRMVEEVNSVNPDVIFIAGDIFTSNYEGLRHPEEYSAELAKMKSKYGVYAVCGNHDVDENLFGGFPISPVSKAFRTKDMEEFFAASGFKVLYDESVELAGGEIVLSGRIDGEKAGDGTANRKNAHDLLADVDKSKPVLVMQHEPIQFKDLAENGADAVFCGHTHNGQMFPGNLVVPFFNENAYGVKKLYGMDTIVTAGVGYYGPPMRIGTDSEVTVVNVSFK